MLYTFGYDTENTIALVDYLQKNYSEGYTVYYERGDDDGDGPASIEIDDDSPINDDETFFELLDACDGGGEFDEEDSYEEDYDYDEDDEDYEEDYE
jgi:hypothetical protein